MKSSQMTNNQLTDEQIAMWRNDAESVMAGGYMFSEEYAAARAICELTAELQKVRSGSKLEPGSDAVLSDERIAAIAEGRAPRYRSEAQSMARELQERRKAEIGG
ncbi:hypothetical protein CEW81_18185 [Kluyvera genomosp. 3]|uniref:Uncharacterized protein n=1 Tax=Kluyvera genomosp. 3 TaxID=2774055 RepID=A0A248KK22_9ENTR|nr:hypothetical protein CEW81_18185 [Kluyvera genomosp. 3]